MAVSQWNSAYKHKGPDTRTSAIPTAYWCLLDWYLQSRPFQPLCVWQTSQVWSAQIRTLDVPPVPDVVSRIQLLFHSFSCILELKSNTYILQIPLQLSTGEVVKCVCVQWEGRNDRGCGCQAASSLHDCYLRHRTRHRCQVLGPGKAMLLAQACSWLGPQAWRARPYLWRLCWAIEKCGSHLATRDVFATFTSSFQFLRSQKSRFYVMLDENF